MGAQGFSWAKGRVRSAVKMKVGRGRDHWTELMEYFGERKGKRTYL